MGDSIISLPDMMGDSANWHQTGNHVHHTAPPPRQVLDAQFRSRRQKFLHAQILLYQQIEASSPCGHLHCRRTLSQYLDEPEQHQAQEESIPAEGTILRTMTIMSPYIQVLSSVYFQSSSLACLRKRYFHINQSFPRHSILSYHL